MQPTQATARTGLLAALATFVSWGLFGLYFKTLSHVPAPEVLAFRVLGGAVSALVVQIALGRMGEVWPIILNPRVALRLGASALAIAVNWGVFLWAVANGRALEASVGYYIFPLLSVVLGWAALGERMTKRQIVAFVIVTIGVGWLVAHGHGVPWVALLLAVSFCLYGLLRKTIAVPALAGLLVETGWLVPLAVAYLLWQGGGAVMSADPVTWGLLALAGPVTAVPLVLFAFAARRLRLSSIGLMMYINPTVQMLVAVFVFGEAFTSAHMVTFIAIWAGVVLYAWPTRTAKA